jgi:hypothetical protein
MHVLEVGYPIWTFCANAAEMASEARVRNDANFIRSNWERRCKRRCK